MFYFLDEELLHLDQFLNRPGAKAMAVYGKKRTGKTRLLTEYISKGDSKAKHHVTVQPDMNKLDMTASENKPVHEEIPNATGHNKKCGKRLCAVGGN